VVNATCIIEMISSKAKRLIMAASIFLLGGVFGAAALATYALITVPETDTECSEERLDVRPKFRDLLKFTLALDGRRDFSVISIR